MCINVKYHPYFYILYVRVKRLLTNNWDIFKSGITLIFFLIFLTNRIKVHIVVLRRRCWFLCVLEMLFVDNREFNNKFGLQVNRNRHVPRALARGPGGVLPPHMGRGVPPILSNPDPVYDKKNGYFNTLFMTWNIKHTEFYPVYDKLTLSMAVKEAESVPYLWFSAKNPYPVYEFRLKK